MKTYLTPEDVRRIIATASNPRDRLMLLLLATTGMRVSELVALTAGNLDADQSQLLTRRLKSRGSETHRLVPLGKAVTEELVRYVGAAKLRENDRLFPLTRQHVHTIVVQTAEAAGFRGKPITLPQSGLRHRVSPHRLRDALAVGWLKRDGTVRGMKTLQDQLGHVSFATTARYYKLSLDDRREIYNEVVQDFLKDL